MSAALQECSLPKDVLLSPILAFLGIVIVAGFLPSPSPFDRSQLNAQTVTVATSSSSSGKGQLESPHPFSLFKGDSFSFYKRLGACAGLEVGSAGCGRLCCIPLREQSGEGSIAPQAGVQAVSPSPDGSVSLARVPKCERAGRNTFPWESGTSGRRVHVRQPCCTVSIWLWVRETWDAGVHWVLLAE